MTRDIIAVARGEAPADLVLRGARVVNVFSGEVVVADVAVKDGVVAGLGDYAAGREVVDAGGLFVLPGLIDAHVHIESTMLSPAGFAAAAAPHGTTAVVADPHEIVNVAGREGLDYMAAASEGLPLDIFYTVPSCVPATPLETGGAEFGPGEVAAALAAVGSPGLGEMMNYPGVLAGDAAVLAKIAAAKGRGLAVDGHAPLVRGRELNAYLSAGIGSDHECTLAEEAREKAALGMHVIIREGSAAKNLLALLPAVTERNAACFSFCTDDRHPADLLGEGEIDNVLRRAVAAGLDAVTAVRMATLHPARHYRLAGLGAVAPGYRADLVLVTDLKDFAVERVYKGGRLVAANGRLVVETPRPEAGRLADTVRLPELKGRFALPPAPAGARANVIEALPGQVMTRRVTLTAAEVAADGELARVAVVERYGRRGDVAVGLVRGFGLKRGALASSVAHDSHNVIVVGKNEADMEAAAQAVGEMHGGLAVVADGEVLAALPLPVGGLMTNEPAGKVAAEHARVEAAAHGLGCTLPAPFMTMSFLALPVIPALKITDRGLVDVERFAFVGLWEA
ncbi:MAG: adenine deaminase [Sporomusaceae bacterium]|nr:adenine deaminase [Sporomusaceae bacterium]